MAGKTATAERVEDRKLERELWYRGDLSYLLRKDAQRRMVEWIDRWQEDHPDQAGPVVAILHRRAGKTFGMICRCFGRLLQKPGIEIRYGAPEEKQLIDFVIPNINKVLAHCPPELRPKKVGRKWTFRNPRWPKGSLASTFTLFGCKNEANAQRGPGADEIVLDEARDIKNLDYVMKDVFGWMLVGKDAPLFTIISTPPRGAYHDFWTGLVDPAQKEDRYLCINVDDNADFSDRDRRMMLKFTGGEGTLSWKVEALCQRESDENDLIIPEFTAMVNGVRAFVRNTSVVEWKKPAYYYPYTFVDSAFSIDYTAILFAYIDWLGQKLIIDDEALFKRATTGEIARLIREGEERVFAGAHYPITRIGDFTPQQLEDLRKHFGVSIRPAEKWDREAGISYLRESFWPRNRIRIHPRCRRLIQQLESGIRDEKGEFMATEELGHCDLIAALVYGHRLVNWHTNPDLSIEHLPFDVIYSPPAGAEKKQVAITHNPVTITRRKLWS